MPHWSTGDEDAQRFFKEAIKSIQDQTDEDWELVIVDDCSGVNVFEWIKETVKDHRNIHLIGKDKREGAGPTRNVGIKWAKERGSPFVLYLDADDVCHRDRLKVTRRIFSENPNASVVYAPFTVIDECSVHVAKEKLTPMLVEHIDSHDFAPEGNNAWIRIGTETGYTNLTSATAVKTDLAYEIPFCASKAGEDAHCWLRYSAAGKEFVISKDIVTLYRVPQNKVGGSSSRALVGRQEFYKTYASTIEKSFKECITLAIANGKISESQVTELLVRFYVRTAETLSKESELSVAKEYLQKALEIDQGGWLTKALIDRNLHQLPWTNLSSQTQI